MSASWSAALRMLLGLQVDFDADGGSKYVASEG
jgi:hypothetical protein